jgi:GDP-L-fucose synthase
LNLPKKILVTGATGVLGRAVLKKLSFERCEVLAPKRCELDLLDQAATTAYLKAHAPDGIIHLAATVFGLGGNMKNQKRAILENSAINLNIFSAVALYPPENFFFAGTVASYPYPYAEMPLREEVFFNGLPHGGEFGYAMAKRHAYGYLKILSEETGMQSTYGVFTNLYGEYDRFNADSGHVIPSLIFKAHDAVSQNIPLCVWGDGSAGRDFLHADDAAQAIILCLSRGDKFQLLNISSAMPMSIKYISERIALEAGISKIQFDTSKPFGIKLRVVDNSRLKKLGFNPEVTIEEGLSRTYRWFLKNQVNIRK